MHYEILVEGQCELTTLSIIMPRILGEYGDRHTWKIHKHQGVGVLPENLLTVNPKDHTLLGQLPAKIRAYSTVNTPEHMVIVLMDIDDKNEDEFLENLCLLIEDLDINIQFCFAIEELEAWFLGDKQAILAAYPNADETIHRTYQQDSICGTWEILAKMLGSKASTYSKRDRRVLKEKCEWAKRIPPNMNMDSNLSPSFQKFKAGLLHFAM